MLEHLTRLFGIILGHLEHQLVMHADDETAANPCLFETDVHQDHRPHQTVGADPLDRQVAAPGEGQPAVDIGFPGRLDDAAAADFHIAARPAAPVVIPQPLLESVIGGEEALLRPLGFGEAQLDPVIDKGALAQPIGPLPIDRPVIDRLGGTALRVGDSATATPAMRAAVSA